jgi:hypothetical protein
MSTTEQITLEVDRLSEPQRQRVLEFARSLEPAAVLPKGVKLSDLRSFVGLFSPTDLKEIESAIEEGCENVDADRW